MHFCNQHNDIYWWLILYQTMTHVLSVTGSLNGLHIAARQQATERAFVSIKRRARGDAEIHRK
jgi:hypothetical protein